MNYVLYHANCPDGTGAAMAAYLKFGEDATYIAVSYGHSPPSMEDSSNVWIIDFSYPRDTLLTLKDRHPNLVVLDHHATAEADLKGLDFCTFDMNCSGAFLAWKHFHPGVLVPLLVLYVQDRDLWHFKLPFSREISAAIGSYPLDFRIWAEWLKNGNSVEELLREGLACLRLQKQQVDKMAKNHRWAVFYSGGGVELTNIRPNSLGASTQGEWTAPAANATVFFSEVGEVLLELHPDAPFSAYFFDRADGNRQWGLRSRPGFDCSVVAKSFGGGGHRQASGFTQPL